MAKKITVFLVASLLLISFSEVLHAQNKLTDQEKKEGFVLLFDGSTSDGWRGYKKDAFPEKWAIEDGTLHFNPELEGSSGDIIFDKKFSNFHLKIDWKIEEGGNSGIFYLGAENDKFGAIYATAPEMQVLDNEKHPDAKLGKNGNRKSGSLYDLIPAVPQNFTGAGEWNTAEVLIKNGHVIHMQNGAVVVEYDYGNQMWEALVAGSKFPGINPDWANLQKEGFIGLQDHGNHVWFRNIKIKEL
jgi:hypothetical protein